MDIILGVIGFTLVVTSFLSVFYPLWRSRGIRRRRLSQDKIVRATVVTRLRNLGSVLTQFALAVCCFLLSGFSTMSAGTEAHAARESMLITMLVTAGILLVLTLTLFFMSQLHEFNFMQVLREHIQRRMAIMNRRKELFHRRRHTRRKTRV